ncbi:MAG: prcA, partial [Ilumatobacteraceae bacterium]|nr:prcA [Ilumatobacteraceae bacterium]
LVAEVGADGAADQMFHILYDGTVMDEGRFSVLGGDAEAITTRMKELEVDALSLEAAVTAATAALSGPDRQLKAEDLEVAVLSRSQGRRCFLRKTDAEVDSLLGG